MNKIIAILALVAATQASAFWGWGDGSGDDVSNGYLDGTGGAEADFSFDFAFSARMRGEGRGAGRGYGRGSGSGYDDEAWIPYYAAPYGFPPPAPAE